MPLQKILFKPGVNRENTRDTTEGGWYETDKVRFRQGTPEKIGGWVQYSAFTFLGVCRSLWNWVTLAGQNLIGLGTSLKFYINHEEKAAEDNAQGDSRETQDEIEHILGMSHDMFKHVLALNTYTEPFLSLKANDQRVIIEQLLGITLLSERADKIKELNRATKDAISQEEMRIRAVQEANKRIEEQIESLKKRQGMWIKKQEDDCVGLQNDISS